MIIPVPEHQFLQKQKGEADAASPCFIYRMLLYRINYLFKCFRMVHGKICEGLPVYFNSFFTKSAHKFRI